MALIEQFDSPQQARERILEMLDTKEVIMGFGHAIYRESDPRNAIIKGWAEKLAENVGDKLLYPIRARSRRRCGTRKAVRKRRFLPRIRLSLHGYTDEAIYADICNFACHGLDRPHHGTTLKQSHYSAECRLHWSRT